MQAAPFLEVAGLDFSYGTLQVLFDVSLDVQRGEVLALLGTNGAGKSTLLRAVAGLARPTAGTIRFAGELTTTCSAPDMVERGLVLVSGGKATFPTLTVEENLRLGGYSLRRHPDRLAAAKDRVFALFPKLRQRAHAKAASLSGGEQQMLALAKGLLLEPRMLCIDELSLGLAPIVVAELMEIVAGLGAQGTTIVLVEQSINIALRLANRAVFMEKGSVRFEGASEELLERDDLARAVFLGSATP